MSLFSRKPQEPENFIMVYTPPPPPVPPNRKPEKFAHGTIVEVDGVLWQANHGYGWDCDWWSWDLYHGEIPGKKKMFRR